MYGPDVAISLMYGSHDMRHTWFPKVDGGKRDPRFLGRHRRPAIRQSYGLSI